MFWMVYLRTHWVSSLNIFPGGSQAAGIAVPPARKYHLPSPCRRARSRRSSCSRARTCRLRLRLAFFRRWDSFDSGLMQGNSLCIQLISKLDWEVKRGLICCPSGDQPSPEPYNRKYKIKTKRLRGVNVDCLLCYDGLMSVYIFDARLNRSAADNCQDGSPSGRGTACVKADRWSITFQHVFLQM
jgi:hypothetical protein